MESVKNLEQAKRLFEKENAWGLLTCIDLKNCNPEAIRSEQKVKEFARLLCEKIKMKRFGETVVVDFGEDERVSGFSMTQLIETSLISGHFVNQVNNAYIDIFSCSPYDPTMAAKFTKEFFGAESVTWQTIVRR